MQDIDNEEFGTIINPTPIKKTAHNDIKSSITWLIIFLITGLFSFYTIISLATVLLDINIPPHSLEEIKSIATYLLTLSSTGSWIDFFKVVFIYASLYLWQQAYSLPGTVLLNILAGYIYGIFLGTLWTSYLTALGSTFAYFIFYKIGTPIMRFEWIQKKTDQMKSQMEKEKETGLFWWLLFARLFPFSPYWFINLASPLINIPISPFFWSTFFGSMPYNFICTQAGTILGELTSTSDIFTLSMMMKLLIVSLVSLIPIFYGKWIQEKLRTWVLEKNNSNHHIDNDIELNHSFTSSHII